MKGRVSLSVIVAAFVWIALFKNSQAYADHQQTDVRFVDSCLGERVAEVTPNGVRLEAEITGLNDSVPVMVDLHLAPLEGIEGDQKIYPLQIRKKIYPKNGRILIQKKLKPSFFYEQLESDFPQRIWIAQLLWFQKEGVNSSSRHLGSTSAPIYILSPSMKSAFVLTDKPICTWETPVEVESDYYFNFSPEAKESIGRKVNWSVNAESEKGLSAGPQRIPSFGAVSINGATGINPITGIPFGFSLWFSPEWRNNLDRNYQLELERRWTLGPEEGGFFGRRYRYTRAPVREYRLLRERQKGCYRWTPTRLGVLDLGRSNLDFYVVPQSLAGDRKKTSDFIEKLMPPLNSCSFETNKLLPTAERVSPEDENEIWYFIPNQQGHLEDPINVDKGIY